MRFAAEKRVLLGWLALLAPLPLPLNEPRPIGVISWPILLLWVLLMAAFLRRARRGDARWLSNRSLNLLGLGYVPILALDLAAAGTGFLIRPMMHLALFALGAKLFSLHRERDKWHALFGVFFIFVTATATSTSLGIIGYLLVFLIAATRTLSRLSSLHMESFETDLPEAAPILKRPQGWLLPATLLFAIPVFALLPRFSNPFFFGGGGGSPNAGTGFSDEVRLDGIGRIRSSSEVALRMDFSKAPSRGYINGLRLRGATYDRYLGDSWERSEETGRLRLRPRDTLVPGDGGFDSSRVFASAQIWLEPLDARAIILPDDTTRLRTDTGGVAVVNRAGALSFLTPPNGTVNYGVDLGPRPRWAAPPGFEDEPTRSQERVSPRVRALAEQVAGEGSALERATSIERHLQSEYGYQLELLSGDGEDAVERFLFERRTGHCEYFATAMVLMLRSQAIPARFVTGFLGAEPSALGYTIVRQSNAHAWVEAFVDGEWRVFDPTPPAGRPTAARDSVWTLGRQAYDWVVFSWDRYVVGFGSGEQQRIWNSLAQWLKSLWAEEAPAAVAEVDEPTASTQTGTASAVEPSSRRLWLLTPLIGIPLLAILLRRRRPDPGQSYLALRKAARAAGVPQDGGPIEFIEAVRRKAPEALSDTESAVVLYMRDSFSPHQLDGEERDRCRQHAAAARRQLRAVAKKAS